MPATQGDAAPGDSASALASLGPDPTPIVPFKRRFVVPAIVLAIAEVVAVGCPIWNAFDLGELGGDTLVRTALPAAIGCSRSARRSSGSTTATSGGSCWSR